MTTAVTLTEGALPMAVEELTPAWLTATLRSAGHDLEVERVEIGNITWGTATKVMLDVTYAGGVQPGGPPRGLCVKAGLDENNRKWATAAGFHVEAAFYGELAPTTDLRVPTCWFSGTDPAHDQALVLLDDLAAAGCTFGRPSTPYTVDQTAMGIKQLAKLHGPTWGWSADKISWLTLGSPTVRAVMAQVWKEPWWSTHYAKEGGPRLPPELDDLDLMLRIYQALWARGDAAPDCVLHGDPHVANTYITPDGKVQFLDWQMMCIAKWSQDFAYFMIGALTVEDRRAHERDLLQHYLDALAAAGGPVMSWDDAWRDYEIDLIHGLTWASCDESLQPLDITSAMADRHIAAILDHDSVTKLGVRR